MMKTNEQATEQETRMGSGSLAARGAPSRVHGLDPASPQGLPARRGLSRPVEVASAEDPASFGLQFVN